MTEKKKVNKKEQKISSKKNNEEADFIEDVLKEIEKNVQEYQKDKEE